MSLVFWTKNIGYKWGSKCPPHPFTWKDLCLKSKPKLHPKLSILAASSSLKVWLTEKAVSPLQKMFNIFKISANVVLEVKTIWKPEETIDCFHFRAEYKMSAVPLSAAVGGEPHISIKWACQEIKYPPPTCHLLLLLSSWHYGGLFLDSRYTNAQIPRLFDLLISC